MADNTKNIKQFAIQSPGNVKCPVCWSPLSSDKLCIRKRRKVSNREQQSENNDQSPDSKLKKLRTLRGDDASSPQELENNVSQQATDQEPHEDTGRLIEPDAFDHEGRVSPLSPLHCKCCEKVIPRDYLMRPAFPVSLVGISNAGKTSFLASMCERFMHNEIQERFNLYCESLSKQNTDKSKDAPDNDKPLNGIISEAIESFQNGGNRIRIPAQTVESHILVDVKKKDKRYPSPYIFKAGLAQNNASKNDIDKRFWSLTSHLQSQVEDVPDNDINIVFHDIIGGFYEQSPDGTGGIDPTFLKNLAGNSIYLIFYDPTRNRNIIDLHNKSLMGTDKDELPLIPPNEIAQSTNALRHLSDGYVRNAAEIIVLVTKFDQFKRLFLNYIKSGAGDKPSNMHYEDAIQFGRLFQYSSTGIDKNILDKHRDFLSKTSNYLKSFLGAGGMGDGFFARIHHYEKIRGDKEILCLPVSALGSSTFVEKGVPYVHSFRPIWVEIVFYLIWEAIRNKLSK